ncbi:pneumococcal-type histidine triad protein [Streptococcus iniae]
MPIDTKPQKPAEKINLLDASIKKTKQGNDGKTYTTDDGYVFSVASIKSYDEDGIIADHEGHEHYIPYSELEDSELKQVQDAINAKDSKIVKVDEVPFH